ncbi:hypothetical protein [Dawidia soli]|uniref:Uncharacterized protein n=1 Tax=Dawidia soli TaxID=2782352 RepID=A0AAP2GL77_9BACT|nr:hypothetical protein [Dawidia soli]MBT1689828.1 hypothetical protein [Dawidia soli]
MDLLTRPHATTASIARRLILLVLVAGVIDPSPGYGRPVFHRIEALFQAAHRHTASCAVAIPSALAGNNVFNDHSPSTGVERYSIPCTKLNTGRINTRALSSPCITTTSFNIPHQNADDDEPCVTTLM